MLNRLLKLEEKLNHKNSLSYKVLHFFMDRINFTVPFRINRLSFKLPIIYGMGIYHFLSTESWFVDIVNKLYLIKSGSFFDIGANIGQTLLRFKSLNISEKYFGFEPNNGSFFYLSQLIAINNFNDCAVFQIALSDENKIMPFYSRHRTDVSATIVENNKTFATSQNAQYLPVYCGDSLIKKIDPEEIGVIKIDVEGAELNVIKGLQNSIKKFKPIIICEILPVYNSEDNKLRLRKERQNELLNLLADSAYSCCRIITGNELKRVDTIEIHSDLSLCNYLFYPNSLGQKLKDLFTIHD